MMSIQPHHPSYVVGTNFTDACIFDSSTFQVAPLPSMSKLLLSECNNKLCNSRNFFKLLREFYDPSTVNQLVVPNAKLKSAESKLSIVRNAGSFGFDNVKLISFETAALIRALSIVKLQPQVNDVCTCLFHMNEQISATTLQFNGESWAPTRRSFTSIKTAHDDLNAFCNNLILDVPFDTQNHKFIVGYSKVLYYRRRTFFENVFQKDNIHFVDIDKTDEYGTIGTIGGFLTKSRILSGDAAVKKYDVANVSDWEYKAVGNGKDLFIFDVQYQRVPLKKEQEIEVESGTYIELQERFFPDRKWIDVPMFAFTTRASMIKLVLSIDHNGIVDFQMVEYPGGKPRSPSAAKVEQPCILPCDPSANAEQEITTSKLQRLQPCADIRHPGNEHLYQNIADLSISSFLSSKPPPPAEASSYEYSEYMVSKDSFMIFYVCKQGRYQIWNTDANNGHVVYTPAYIGLHSLPPVVGEQALQQFQDHVESTVYDFIPMFGKEFSQIQIDQKWKFQIVKSKNSRYADIRLQTQRGKRRCTISSLMSIMFKHLHEITKRNVSVPVSKVKVSFSCDLRFSNNDLLREALRNANLDLLED